MKLRGIVRLAAVTAVTALFVGVVGAPARAEGTPTDLPGGLLNIPDAGVWPATAQHKGCEGIDKGVAAVGRDGWLFNSPESTYKSISYLFVYFKGTVDEPTDAMFLWLDANGIAEFSADISKLSVPGKGDLPAAVKAKLAPKIKAHASGNNSDLPTVPARAGVAGKIVDGIAWVQTPTGWGLGFGLVITDPPVTGEDAFELLRVCAASTESPSPSVPASPSPSKSAPATPSLPVTGTNVWLLTGGGAVLVAAGAVLFLAYRRRQNVKFVA